MGGERGERGREGLPKNLDRDTIYLGGSTDGIQTAVAKRRERALATSRLPVIASLRSSGTASGNFCISAKRPPGPTESNRSSTSSCSPLRGCRRETRPTVKALSQRLCLRHHSTVELIDRLVEQGAVTRRQSDVDHREVLIELTPHGEELLRRLSILHWQELKDFRARTFRSAFGLTNRLGGIEKGAA